MTAILVPDEIDKAFNALEKSLGKQELMEMALLEFLEDSGRHQAGQRGHERISG
jgi:hypothetical protein